MTTHLSGNGEQTVRPLGAQERDDQLKLAMLHQENAIGIEQADRRELTPFDPQVALAHVRSRQSPRAGPS